MKQKKWNHKKYSQKQLAILFFSCVTTITCFQNCGTGFAPTTINNGVSSQGSTISDVAMSAIIDWDPSLTSQTIGYRVYVGTEHDTYDHNIDAGLTADPKAPEFTISSLDSTKTYYVVVKAYDALGNESLASNEVQITTHPN